MNDLYRWLEQDAEVRGTAEVRLVQSEQLGQQGALEIVDVVLTHATGLLGLVLAYASWRRARPDAPAVVFERDGVVVNVRDGDEATLRRVVAALTPNEEHGVDH